MSFPVHRPRRLRRNERIMSMVRETQLLVTDLIYPLFVAEELAQPKPIGSLPGQFQHTLESLRREAEEAVRLGVPAVILFGVPAQKDAVGSQAYDPEGIVQKATQALKREFGSDLAVLTDLCLDEFTDHGHCGLVRDEEILNDETLELYGRIAVAQAQAGADMVGPSGMMDGQVGVIREALDEAGYAEVGIMAYSAKYASAFYGPFREAAESAPQFGDRCSYQMDPPNRQEAFREIELDIEEGADIIMVKPALAYMDIIREAADRYPIPLAAYNVSAEYSMVKAAAERGWIDGNRVMMEILTGLKRAGAGIILTYHAIEAARILRRS